MKKSNKVLKIKDKMCQSQWKDKNKKRKKRNKKKKEIKFKND